MLGINLDKGADKKKAKAILERYQATWNTILAGEGSETHILNDYAIRGLPTTYLIDREGKIIAGPNAHRELMDHLKKLR